MIRPARAPITPAALCRGLLNAVEASEGRRRRRARDTTPDRIGLQLRRDMLEAIVRDDPPADAFEQWLFARCLEATHGAGAVRATARAIWEEWRVALHAPEFEHWLAAGAPSDDRWVEGRSECPVSWREDRRA